MSIKKARENTIKQQIRAWGGLNNIANAALEKIPRELFTDKEYKDLAFADIEIPIGYDEKMFFPKVEGRILDALAITNTDKVLEIGTGSGYLTAVMSLICNQITSIEINENLYKLSLSRLNKLSIKNANLVLGDASLVINNKDFFDVVLVGASIPKVTDKYLHLLSVYGRIFVIEGKKSPMQAKLITRINDIKWRTKTLFETELKTMQGLKQTNEFKF